ncbi:MAG: glycosyltransferase family 4 protein [Phycisphaerae bacterium]
MEMLFRSSVWPLLGAAAATLVAVPLVRRLAVALDLFDRPDAGLKPHEKPIPYLGGVALYCGWVATAVLFCRFHPLDRQPMAWIVLAGSASMVVGLIDDIRGLRPTSRILAQVAVAGVLLYAGIGRVVVSSLVRPFEGIMPEFVTAEPIGTVLGFVFCAAVLAGATNATNLIDGLDGLCAGVAGIAACGFLVEVWLLGEAGAISSTDSGLIVVLCVGMLGACLAFLVFNFNPASMFMGDSGSLLLGFSVALVIILFAEHASWRGLSAALVCFGFPIFDTGLAVGRRWRNGKPLFIGDRSHFYDQIRDRGLTVRQTVLVCYGLGLAFAVLGAVMTRLPEVWAMLIFGAIPVVAGFACWRGGLYRVDDAAERSGPG